jgi:hypothetical protein
MCLQALLSDIECSLARCCRFGWERAHLGLLLKMLLSRRWNLRQHSNLKSQSRRQR